MITSSPIRVTNTGVNLTTGAASVSSALPNNSAGLPPRYVVVTATAAAHIRFGKIAATAIATDLMIVPGMGMLLDVKGFDFVAAIQDTATGTVNIAPVEM